MKRRTLAAIGAAGLLTALTATGCSTAARSSPTSAAAADAASAPAASAPAASAPAASAGVVLPVASNPIANAATAPTLAITYAAVEDNVDPATGKAIDDRLQLTLKNSGSTPLTGIEVYYEMTDIVTGAKEGYYQKLDGLTIPAGKDATVYFDNKTDPGHYPENQFSIYRSSTNEVDFAIQASALGAKVAIATAVKATGTGEKVD
jgi:hypothetical protein